MTCPSRERRKLVDNLVGSKALSEAKCGEEESYRVLCDAATTNPRFKQGVQRLYAALDGGGNVSPADLAIMLNKEGISTSYRQAHGNDDNH